MLKETPLKDLFTYHPKKYEDNRGFFCESYKQTVFNDADICVDFIQENVSSSAYGTLRGLHFQKGEHSQSKLIRVLKGEIYDVVVDLRKSSPTFMQWYGLNLTEDSMISLYVPKGFAHGFLTLSHNAVIQYKVDTGYSPDSEAGIFYLDTDLNIDWPSIDKSYIISEKDLKLQTLSDKYTFR